MTVGSPIDRLAEALSMSQYLWDKKKDHYKVSRVARSRIKLYWEPEGPAGALISYVVVGIGVICIIEGIAEMIGYWPIANAMFEFVKAFVDKDLAIVVGLAYCYVYFTPEIA